MRSQWLQKTSAVVLSLVMAATLIPSIPKAQRVSAAEGDVEVNNTNFPDSNFQDWLKAKVPGADDGTLTQDELAAVKVMNVSGSGTTNIADFTGLDNFQNLEELYITGNTITSGMLDLSVLTKLKTIYIDSCGLNSVTLGNNTNLDYIQCQKNNLTTLDVSENIGLTQIMCNNNKITSLDLSNNINMGRVDCYSNGMTTLKLGESKDFVTVRCEDNKLTSLDVTKLENLNALWCYKNQLSSLDLSKSTKLSSLVSFNNWSLHTLDLRNSPLLSQLMPGYSGLVSIVVNQEAPLNETDYLDNNKVTVLATPTSADGDYEYDLADIDPNIDGSKITIAATDIEKGMSISGTKLKGLKLGETVTYDYKITEDKAITVTVTAYKDSPAWNYFTTPLAIEGWEVGQTPNKPVAVADKGEVTFTYSDKKDGTYGDLPANPHAGTWYVKASVEKTDEYIGLSEIKSFEIKEKATTATQPSTTTTPTKVSITKAITAKVKATTYTGYKKKPAVTVTYNGKKLKKGTDYTVSYKNNTKVGTAKVIIKGKGNYTGTKTVTFKIKKRTKVAKGIYVVKHDVYGRKGPVKAKKITMVFHKGDKVTVTKLSNKVGKNRWVKVTKNGKSAYVFSKYLK